jgi:hypothetical protein
MQMGRPFFTGIDFDLNTVYDYRPAGEEARTIKQLFSALLSFSPSV